MRALLAAVDANEAAGIRAVFAVAALQAYSDGAPKTGEAFLRWLQSDVIDRHGKVASLAMAGNEVFATVQFSNNADYRSPANFLFELSDGRIVGWQRRY